MHIIKTQSKTHSKSAFLKHLFKDHIFESAATLSYYFLFSVFPLAIFISAAFSTLNISPDVLQTLSRFIPQNILQTLENYLTEISLGNTPTLILIGVVLTLYSMGKAIQTMKRKFRHSYGVRSRNNSLSEWIVSLVFVLLVMVSFYAMLILIVAGNYIVDWILSFFPYFAATLPSFQIFRLLAVTSYLLFVLLGLYFVLPGIKQRVLAVLPGTLFALVSWVLMSYLFSYYLAFFSNLTTLYGSLSAIIALLTWLFLINLILIIGSRINSYLYLVARGNQHDQHHPVLH